MTVNVKQLLRFYHYINMEDGTETTNIDEEWHWVYQSSA